MYPRHPRAHEARARQEGFSEHGVVEPGVIELRSAQVRPFEAGLAQVRPREIRAGQPGAAQIRARGIDIPQVGFPQVRAFQARSTQIGAGQIRSGEYRSVEILVRKVRVFEICADQTGLIDRFGQVGSREMPCNRSDERGENGVSTAGLHSGRYVHGGQAHRSGELGLRGDAAYVGPYALVIGNGGGGVDVVRYEISHRSAGLAEQHERMAWLDRIGDIRHRSYGADIVAQLHQIARCDAEPLRILRMHLQKGDRETTLVEGDELMVIGGLPDVIGAAVVHPEAIALALLRDLGGISGPGPRRGNEASLARRSCELAVFVQSHRSYRSAVHDAYRRLDAVVAQP